jgi:predicted Zn-dependent protease
MRIKISQLIITSLFFIFIVSSCATSPTGRSQLHLISAEQMDQMGVAAYDDLKKNTPQSKNEKTKKYVTCVANAITRKIKFSTQWEVTVFEDASVNAFALPGGKIGVYTGLLNVTENQHQLAAVIAHEVAHVTAEHANARVSAAYATGASLKLVEVIAGATTPGKQRLVGLLGVGVQYGVLMPYGRGQESEADILGLDYMAMAGFDPRESVLLWRNMSKQGGAQPPEFLSTHPANQSRINDLNARMPHALVIYNAALASGKKPNCKN